VSCLVARKKPVCPPFCDSKEVPNKLKLATVVWALTRDVMVAWCIYFACTGNGVFVVGILNELVCYAVSFLYF